MQRACSKVVLLPSLPEDVLPEAVLTAGIEFYHLQLGRVSLGVAAHEDTPTSCRPGAPPGSAPCPGDVFTCWVLTVFCCFPVGARLYPACFLLEHWFVS